MAYEFVAQCKKTDKLLRGRLHGVIKIEPVDTLQQPLDKSDDGCASIKIEPIEGIIVKSIFDQDNTSIIVIEDYPEDDIINQGFLDYRGMEFDENDIIEVDEDFVEETSDLNNCINYTFENTAEVTTENTTLTLQPDIDQQAVTKSSTRSKRVASTSKIKTKKLSKLKPRKTWTCPFCPSTFTEYAKFVAHKRSHGLACRICGKTFSRVGGLKSHMEIHNGSKALCHLCSKECSNHGNLVRHIRHCHDKIRPHSCDVCGAQFSRRSSLQLHVASHSDERNYVCDVCDKRFKTPMAVYYHKRKHRPDFDKSWRKRYEKCNSVGNLIVHRLIHSGVKEFECLVCHKGFHSKTALKIHTRIHTDERPYSCDICGKDFRQAANLKTHKLRIHEPEAARRYTCNFCEKCFTSSGTLRVHERIHTGEKPYKCDTEDYPEDDVINQGFLDYRGMEFDENDIIEVDEDFVEGTSDLNNCINDTFENTAEVTTENTTLTLQPDIDQQAVTKSSTISKRVTSTSKVKTKKLSKLKPRETWTCPFCPSTFTEYMKFVVHKRSHGRVCSICGKTFSRVSGLKSHMEIHKGSKALCHLCPKECSNSANLLRHIRQCHDKIRPHCCDVCGAQFSRRSSLQQHVATHSDERNYVCDVCDKRFKTPTAVNYHKRIHRPDFDTSRRKRYKKCNSAGNLIAHRLIHSGVKEFECSVCHKIFHCKATLERHTLSHTGERPYSCDICGKGFRQAVHLKTHKLGIHDPEAARRYTCKFCEKRFTSSGTLRVHERIHTGEKPYKCDQCLACFIDIKGLKGHHRKVHSMEALNVEQENTTKIVVLDEHCLTIHGSDIGELSINLKDTVDSQDVCLDPYNEI